MCRSAGLYLHLGRLHLGLIKGGVKPPTGHELLVCALIGDPPVVQDKYTIRSCDGRQPMGYNKGCPVHHEVFFQGFLDQAFDFRIQRRSGFIQ